MGPTDQRHLTSHSLLQRIYLLADFKWEGWRGREVVTAGEQKNLMVKHFLYAVLYELQPDFDSTDK